MIELCLFDLDDTLVRTTDLRKVREAGVRNDSPEYLKELTTAVGDISKRRLYQQAHLEQIRAEFPDIALGVFTRAPRSYANCLLKLAYPGFGWDTVIGYEDVKPTKPYGKGIRSAMDKFDVDYLSHTIMVGDNDADVRAAYNCGCIVVLDRSSWPNNWKDWEYDHWDALGHIPDAIITSPDQLIEALKDPDSFLPELERLLENGNRRSTSRFDEIGHFIPKALGGDNTPYRISVAGRFFPAYDSTSERRKWHELTKSIAENKSAEQFPDAWVSAVRTFVGKKFPSFFGPKEIKIAVIPHRPERPARLESFLGQLQASVEEKPIGKLKVSFHPDLLAYKDGVKSQHGDKLGQLDRFKNVRDHLHVNRPKLITPGAAFVVIDDVTTTGASLIYAAKYLREAGAASVTCLSMAKNIGDLYK